MTYGVEYYAILAVTLTSVVLLGSTFVKIMTNGSAYWSDGDDASCPLGYDQDRVGGKKKRR